MAKPNEVLTMLCPEIEWTIYGDQYENIVWNSGKPAITKKEFTDGFAKFDEQKNQENAAQAASKSALLEKLGITEDEAKLLLA